MEEGQITTDGLTRTLAKPFFVIATQNSVEMTGTYPLPEAQLDRFVARISLGYPDKESEKRVLDDRQTAQPLDLVAQVVGLESLIEAQRKVKEVFVHDTIKDYIVETVRATRASNQLLLGASPRATIQLMRAAQAKAVLNGASTVMPDHVKSVAPNILGHRVITRAEVRAKGMDVDDVIRSIQETIPTPLPIG